MCVWTVLKEILRSKDRDNKGYVNIEELGDCLEAFGFNPDYEDLEFLKKHMDDNGMSQHNVWRHTTSVANVTLQCHSVREHNDVIWRLSSYGSFLFTLICIHVLYNCLCFLMNQQELYDTGFSTMPFKPRVFLGDGRLEVQEILDNIEVRILF